MKFNLVSKALLIIMLVPLHSYANVYKCKINGVQTFSQTPCGEDSETTEYKLTDPDSPSKNPSVKDGKQVSIAPAEKNSVDQYIEIRQIKRKISKLEWQKKDLITSRDKEIDDLRKRKTSANNNLAGASYLQSLSQEMSAVANTYAMDIESIDRELSELRMELRQLEN